MKRIEAKTILEGLGIIALVASLLFVGYQLQQDRELAAAQVIVTHDANQLELIALITENKEVWLKGLSGATLSATDDITFRALAEAHLRKHSGMHQRMPLLGFDSRMSVAAQYAYDLYQYPRLREIYVERKIRNDRRRESLGVQGSSVFVRQVDELLADLDRAGPEIEDRTFFPF